MSYFKPRNLLLVLALVLALVLLTVIASRHSPEDQLRAVIKTLPEGIDVALQDIDYTHIEDGLASWRMVAKQVERQTGDGILTVVSPRLSFFDKLGEVVGSMEAGKGMVSEDYQKVQLQKNVIIKDAGGYTLYTELLDYDHGSQTATTDAHVRLEAKGLQLEGRGLDFNVPKKKLHLHADVSGYFKPQ